MSESKPKKRAAPKGPRNHVAEWFGHRVYPVVADTPESLRDQQSKRCPFLSLATGQQHECIKPAQSLGVCTISTSNAGGRQDWLVCPFRVVEPNLLDDAARRLFGHNPSIDIMLVPAPILTVQEKAEQFRAAAMNGTPCMVYFQNKLGGEISLSATRALPRILLRLYHGRSLGRRCGKSNARPLWNFRNSDYGLPW